MGHFYFARDNFQITGPTKTQSGFCLFFGCYSQRGWRTVKNRPKAIKGDSFSCSLALYSRQPLTVFASYKLLSAQKEMAGRTCSVSYLLERDYSSRRWCRGRVDTPCKLPTARRHTGWQPTRLRYYPVGIDL